MKLKFYLMYYPLSEEECPRQFYMDTQKFERGKTYKVTFIPPEKLDGTYDLVVIFESDGEPFHTVHRPLKDEQGYPRRRVLSSGDQLHIFYSVEVEDRDIGLHVA